MRHIGPGFWLASRRYLVLVVPVVVVCHVVGVRWPWSALYCFGGGVVMGVWWGLHGR